MGVEFASEARHGSGEVLHGHLERPLCEAMKVTPGFYWRPQDVGDTRAVVHLPGRATGWVWNQAKREKFVALSNAGRRWGSEECFDVGFDLSHRASFPSFRNGHVYSVPLFVGSMRSAFFF